MGRCERKFERIPLLQVAVAFPNCSWSILSQYGPHQSTLVDFWSFANLPFISFSLIWNPIRAKQEVRGPWHSASRHTNATQMFHRINFWKKCTCPKTTLTTRRSKVPTICDTGLPESHISPNFSLRAGVFEFPAILRQVQWMTLKWLWRLQNQRCAIYVSGPKFWLFFSSHGPFCETCTRWPPTDLNTTRSKASHISLTTDPSWVSNFTTFHPTASHFQAIGILRQVHWITP